MLGSHCNASNVRAYAMREMGRIISCFFFQDGGRLGHASLACACIIAFTREAQMQAQAKYNKMESFLFWHFNLRLRFHCASAHVFFLASALASVFALLV